MSNGEKLVSQDEVFGEWLKHECNGKLRDVIPKKYLPGVLAVVNRADYKNKLDNERKIKLLVGLRPFVKDFIIGKYKVQNWYIKTLNKRDVEKIEVIHSGPWREISKSFKAIDIASAIFNSEKFDSLESIKYIKKNYKEIVSQKRRITAVGTSIEDAILVDGAHQSIAILYYKLKEEVEPTDKEIYFGLTAMPYNKEFL